MFIGGAERSLLGIFEKFDYDKYEVSLFLYRHEGEFMKYIDENVSLIPEIKEYCTFDVPIKSLLQSKLWKFGVRRIVAKTKSVLKRKFSHMHYGVWASMQSISKTLLPLLPNIPGEYDVAISFLGIPDVLINKVNAEIKIAWNHTDYTILGPDEAYDKILYSKINYIVSVSNPCTEQFLSVYPEFSSKAITIQNVLSDSLIKKQSKEKINVKFKTDTINLLSIGRFCEAKNFDNVPFICKKIREKGLDVKWYLIGYGGDEPLIRQKIEEADMQEHVIILGKKENPYPYIKACDIYVQPSRYEGKCVSVIEAQMLNKPVIITNYATSGSQLEDGVDGVIVPMNNDGCAEGIVAVMSDKDLRQRLIENTKTRDYSNSGEIQKIYDIIGK